MDSNSLALFILVISIVTAFGAYAVIVFKKESGKVDEIIKKDTSEKELYRDQEPVVKQHKHAVHEVFLNEWSATDVKIGVWSGVKFGFGFALGSFIFGALVFLTFGGVIVAYLGSLISRSVF